MKNMQVSKKLIVSFLIVALLCAVVGGFGIFGMMQINDGAASMYDNQTVPLPYMTHIIQDLQGLRVSVREYYIAAVNGDSARIESLNAEVAAIIRSIGPYLDSYYDTIIVPDAKELFAETRAMLNNEYGPHLNRVYEFAKEGNLEAIRADIEAVSGTYFTITDNLSALLDMKIKAASEANDDGDALFSSMLTIIIVVLAIALGIAMFLGVYISGIISKPLNVLSAFMKKAGSTGDITLSPSEMKAIEEYGKAKDEIGQSISASASFLNHVTNIADELETVSKGNLRVEVKPLSDADTMGNSLKAMVDSLNRMFVEISASTAQVSVGSKQIADGAQSLAQGSTEQAASIEELSASISDMSEKTKGNAEMAAKASALANNIKGNAEKGSSQMGEMMTAVNEISEASQSIGKVIKVIDDIAFQTNILALNAAVEAARAGQHGKGFAVVAEEVRNLAAKSAEAAKDTSNLIANSIEKAELGSSIADATSASLAEIVSGIEESALIASEIASSSEVQLSGIMEINNGIDQVAQVVQQNSATAQESAAASQEMSGQSDMLEKMVGQFKLKGSEANRGLAHGRTAIDHSGSSGGFGKY